MTNTKRTLSALQILMPLVEEGFSGQDILDFLVSVMNRLTFVEKTADYTITTDDRFILGDATGGAISLTLPPAASAEEFVVTIKRKNGGGNVVSVYPDGLDEIDGSNSNRNLASQYATMTLISDGVSGWWVVKADG